MRAWRRLGVPAALVFAVSAVPAAAAPLTVHVQKYPTVRSTIHLHFSAPSLPGGGYYYAVVVLRRYRRYTRNSPPHCSTSSDMQRTDYGYPASNGVVGLALTPSRSATHHWCRGGTYEGAIYAVPHAPPCESSYPCEAEAYKRPCAGVAPGCVEGVVAKPGVWEYPEPLPSPKAEGTTIDARFTLTLEH